MHSWEKPNRKTCDNNRLFPYSSKPYNAFITLTAEQYSMSFSSRAPHPRLILASSSRYRAELLSRLRLPFDVIVPAIDETPLTGEAPDRTAIRLAQKKAEAVAVMAPEALIIGSDQVATLDGEQIGKPGSHENALDQLQKMRGREVIFHTALALCDGRA